MFVVLKDDGAWCSTLPGGPGVTFHTNDAEERALMHAVGYLLHWLVSDLRLVERQSALVGDVNITDETICVRGFHRRFHIQRVTERDLSKATAIGEDPAKNDKVKITDIVVECPGDCQPLLTLEQTAQVRDLLAPFDKPTA